MTTYQHLKKEDPEIYKYLEAEVARQNDGLEMIPSENHTSPAVLEALGSRLTDKYSEGYPGIRYYGGCENVDAIENIARDRAKKLFGVDHANVQPLSGSPANQAVYFALMDPGDTLMGQHLFFGGHMTHGLKVNFSGTIYNGVQYSARPDGYMDFDEMRELARKHKPKVIIIGGTAYPRQYEWDKVKEIADKVGAFLLADISHISGLVIAGVHPSPVGIADVIMTTTHKTLRGPRGAIILCNGKPSTPLKKVERTRENLPTLIDRAIIPGLQGGPHNHQTAAIAVALKEAATPEFKKYGQQIVKNAKQLAETFMAGGLRLITGGTDNHLILADVTPFGLTGQQAEQLLTSVQITVNKNTIPHDPRKPFDPSGIRLGTPALTTRGFKEDDMKIVAGLIVKILKNPNDETIKEEVRNKVKELCEKYPLYPEMRIS